MIHRIIWNRIFSNSLVILLAVFLYFLASAMLLIVHYSEPIV